ncbi:MULTISPECIES: hypothetical protein [unclassified Mesorhizobium]|uniref:hypothetical protein n=2 Tax=unclassified Mesorhizobium TaxID=325217 RepID=UPI001FDF8626|nr:MULTISPECIES: hypothetical protein [unclassified Mesorhizobium]
MEMANKEAGPLRTEPAFEIEVVEQAELKQRGRKAQDGLTPQQRWQNANPLARWAHLATTSAIKKGILVRQSCAICGSTRTDFHHDPRFYDQPLRGTWLCRLHHVAEHRRLRQEGGDQ